MLAGYRIGKAAAAGVRFVETLLAPIKVAGPLPAGFWSDPFCLGFVHACVANVINVTTKGKLKTEEKGYAAFSVFRHFIGDDQARSVLNSIFQWSISGSEPYNLGTRHANKYAAYAFKMADLSHDPEVIEARKLAYGSGLATDASAVDGALLWLLFVHEVNKRLRGNDRQSAVGRVA